MNDKRNESLNLLASLVKEAVPVMFNGDPERIAEHLLDYGVEVPPIKLGTDVYTMWYDPGQEEWIIDKVTYTSAVAWRFNHVGLDVFLTRQEALEKRLELRHGRK